MTTRISANAASAMVDAPRVKKRLLTGDRPTGELQDEYECYFVIADLHVLTTRPEKEAIAPLPDIFRSMLLDYLSAGIDPERSTIYIQSMIQETYCLNTIFEMLVTLPRLTRLPSIKDM